MAISDQGVLANQGIRDYHENRCYGCAGLAEGTNSATLQTANIVHYNVGGQAYVKAITDNIAMTACAAQAVLTSCLYLVTINAAGTVKVTKGTEYLTTAVTAGTSTLKLPACPDSEAVLGAFKIVLTSSATFTSGTTDLGAANVADTYANFGFYPEDGSVAQFTFA
jgi:hypothetical protein